MSSFPEKPLSTELSHRTSSEDLSGTGHPAVSVGSVAAHGSMIFSHPHEQNDALRKERSQYATTEAAASSVPTLPTVDSTDMSHSAFQYIDIVPESIDQVPLLRKVVGDVFAGSVVAASVAPFLTIVDKAIVERSAGTKTLVESGTASARTILQNPGAYIRSPAFLLMWAVYASTYSTANSLRTVSQHDFGDLTRTTTTGLTTTTTKRTIRSRSDTVGYYGQEMSNSLLSIFTGPYAIFFGTAFVNSSASLVKDRAYARMFNGASAAAAAVPKKVPPGSYALWMCRDFTVVGSSFILPDMVARTVTDRNPTDVNYDDVKKTTQVVLPIVSQFLAGPMHFLGLDLYNRSLGLQSWPTAIADRARALQKNFAPVVSARIARIAPGYSMGGVFNTWLRDGWRDTVLRDSRSRPTGMPTRHGVPILGVKTTSAEAGSTANSGD